VTGKTEGCHCNDVIFNLSALYLTMVEWMQGFFTCVQPTKWSTQKLEKCKQYSSILGVIVVVVVIIVTAAIVVVVVVIIIILTIVAVVVVIVIIIIIIVLVSGGGGGGDGGGGGG